MANERVQMNRNTSTTDTPNWERYFPKTVADAVLMSDDGTETVEDNLIITWDTAATADVGGIAKGDTYESTSLAQIVYDMAHPYVAPTIGTRSITPSTTVYENGVTATITAVSVPITKGSASVTAVDLLYGSTVLAPASSTVVANINSSSAAVTVSFSSLSQSITKSSTYKYLTVRVTDSTGKTTSQNTNTLSFVYPYYWGVLDASTALTASAITGLTKRTVAKGAQSLSYTADNQCMVFASPYAVSKITDPNNFDVTSTFTETSVSITGTDGTAQSYYVYESEATTVSSFTMKFTH